MITIDVCTWIGVQQYICGIAELTNYIDKYIYIYIYIYNCLCGSGAKASDTHAVGHGFEPRPEDKLILKWVLKYYLEVILYSGFEGTLEPYMVISENFI